MCPLAIPSFLLSSEDSCLKKKAHAFILKSKIATTLLGGICGFCIYFSMYGFRKVFSAVEYADAPKVFKLEFKIAAILLQLFGYMLSKFAGIVLVSGLDPRMRPFILVTFILIAELALVGFAVIPRPYNVICMFFNGLPLGVYWGIVFSYLEGRRTTEALACAMCFAFIVAPSAVKLVGLQLVKLGVSEFWMAAAAGAIFLPIIFLFIFLIELLPPPDEDDKKHRTERIPMTNADRIAFLKLFWPGIICMTLFALTCTSFRDYRDDFARELFKEMEIHDFSKYSHTEIIVGFCVITPIGLMMLIKSNFIAFLGYHVAIIIIDVAFGITTYLYHHGKFDPFFWMVMAGIAVYIGYVPYNAMIFDRMVATFRIKSNCGFLVYVTDACGYAGSAIMLLLKNFGGTFNYLEFFKIFAYVMAFTGVSIHIISAIYYAIRYKQLDIKKKEEEEINKLDNSSLDEKADSSLSVSTQSTVSNVEESDATTVLEEL